MPKVRYTYRIDGEADTFSETDILPRSMNIELRGKQQVMLWNEKSEVTGEPLRTLVKVEVIDSIIHEHEWHVIVPGYVTGSKDYVQCNHCSCRGRGERYGHVDRDPGWQENKWEYCRDPLTKLRKPTFK